MATPLDLGFQSNKGRFGHDGTARLINCYAELRGKEGKSPVTIYADPGLKSFGSASGHTKGTRGFIEVGDYLYWVVDRSLYRVDSTGSETLIGGLADDGPVVMARNSKTPYPEIVIVTAGGLRFIVENDVLSTISDEDLPPPIAAAYLDGYMLYLIADGRLFYSEINDASNILSTSFVEAEAKPDGANALVVLSREAFVFGTKTIQSFQTTGDSDNPIVPLRGAPIEEGCLAGPTAIVVDNTPYFVAADRTVRRLNGYTPEKISPPYVDELLRAETNTENLRADTYAIQGHEYYVLSGTSFTVVYDAATQLWHDKESQNEDRWTVQGIVHFGDKVIAGDKDDGTLYEIDPDTYDENGSELIMTIQTKQQHAFPDSLIFDTLYLDFATGVGLNSTNTCDSNPVVMLRYSDDAGRAWSNEMTAPLGAIGKYDTVVAFHGLGETGRIGRTFQISVSAKVSRALMGASADLMRVAA